MMNTNKSKARIIGMGSAIPEKVLTNQDLEQMVETSDEWIVTRTGIEERRLASNDEHSSTLGSEAGRKALKDAAIAPEDVDLILMATMTPDYLIPSTAALVQKQLGAVNAAAFDLQAACSGHLYGLSMAKAYIESGMFRNILLISSEKMSSFVDWEDRTTCVLFGDGASACVVAKEGSGLLIESVSIGTDGSLAEVLYIPAGGSREPTSEESVKGNRHFIKMRGQELFRHAVRRMVSASEQCLEQAQLDLNAISWMVPHQANLRIIKAVAERLNVSMDKVFLTLQKYGNTSASGVAIALDELRQSHTVEHGQHLLLTAFGAGLTWGSALLTRIDQEGE